ncbi:MAG: phage tail tape measure protein, partial [Parasporobacterium sp.]|nr:phage tail tape measure protein [Parasporobacterium sp.]
MAGSRIKGITVEIGGDVTGLEKALKSVNTTIKQTQSQLKDVERLLKIDPSNTELLAQKQEKLKDAVTATKEKLDALKTAQEQAKQQMESGDLGKDKYDALQREIIETEQELERLAKQAAESNTALTKIGEAGKALENVGNKMADVGSSLTRNVTMPIAAIGTAAVKTTADFDAQMSKVSAISGATGKEFDALREKAREMGAKTKFSATEAGQAFEYMAMAGWKTGDMLDGIEGIMSLAAASGEDLATTSDIVTDALTAFG